LQRNERGNSPSEERLNETRIDEMVGFVIKGTDDPEKMVRLFQKGGIIYEFVNNDNRRNTKPHQLRAFYSTLVGLVELNKTANSEVRKAIRFELARMSPMAHYREGRNLIDKRYANFIRKCATEVAKKPDTEFTKSLERFRHVYEAIIAYAVD